MILRRTGREFVRWPYTADVPITGADVYLAGAWHPATVTATDVALLVSGPDTTGFIPDGTVALAAGIHYPLLRFTDNPELVVRDGGVIAVVD